VKIPEDDANQLIKRRKDEHGSVNREVYALINFKITHSLDQSNKKLEPDNRTETQRKIDYMTTGRNEKDYERQLIGEITSIELYESDRLNDLIGLIE
jgi:hypothetical protein